MARRDAALARIALLVFGLLSALGVLLGAGAARAEAGVAYHWIETSGSSCSPRRLAAVARAGDSEWPGCVAAALLRIADHAISKALLFSARVFERAVGSLDLDRLGDLLRRMPWTGGAYLVGSMAIRGCRR